MFSLVSISESLSRTLDWSLLNWKISHWSQRSHSPLMYRLLQMNIKGDFDVFFYWSKRNFRRRVIAEPLSELTTPSTSSKIINFGFDLCSKSLKENPLVRKFPTFLINSYPDLSSDVLTIMYSKSKI